MGVRFDSTQNCFVFDFGHDGHNDNIELAGSGYEVYDYDLVVMPESSSKVNLPLDSQINNSLCHK